MRAWKQCCCLRHNLFTLFTVVFRVTVSVILPSSKLVSAWPSSSVSSSHHHLLVLIATTIITRPTPLLLLIIVVTSLSSSSSSACLPMPHLDIWCRPSEPACNAFFRYERRTGDPCIMQMLCCSGTVSTPFALLKHARLLETSCLYSHKKSRIQECSHL